MTRPPPLLVTGGALKGRTASELAQRQTPVIEAGTTLGPYVVERLIGQGGAGAVYLARRQVGFEQRVAIKTVAKSSSWSQRFARERETLGRLSHRAIVRIFDAGESDTVSWLAMEYVEGTAIDKDAARRRLDWTSRVQLMADICDALHYAHRELIVHGDLKPGNILVDAQGDPKIVDFGIATDLRSADDTGDHAFTPAFASPEQAAAQRLTTASDTFQCGRLLQVLCLLDESVPMPAWAREDLDAICDRATAPDPAARYESAAALAADLRALLEVRPVAAHPSSRGYRGRRLLRRHRAGVAAALTLALALAGGLVGSLWQAHRAQLHAEEAQRQARNAERSAQFVVSLLQAGNPEASNAPRSVVALLRDADARIDGELADLPLAAAQMRVTIGESLSALGHLPEGIDALERGVEQLRALGEPARRELARTLHTLASRQLTASRVEEAIATSEDALHQFDVLGEPVSLDRLAAMTVVARALGMRNRLDEQRVLYRRILADRTQLLGPDDSRLAVDWNNLGAAALQSDDYAEAEESYRQALRTIVLPPAAPESRQAWLHAGLGVVYANSWRFDEADASLAQAKAVAERLLGPDHPLLGAIAVGQANVRNLQGQFVEAETLARRAIGLYAPIDHIDRFSADIQLGFAELGQHRYEDAAATFREARQRALAVRGEDEPLSWIAVAGEGLAQIRAGDRNGLDTMQQAIAVLDTHPDWPQRARVRVLGLLVEANQHLGDTAAVRRWRERELAQHRDLLGLEHARVIELAAALDIVPVPPTDTR